MFSQIKSIFRKNDRLDEPQMTLLEYGVTPNDVLANYIGARDCGQPQKAYLYLCSNDKRKMSFAKFIKKIEMDPFVVKTVSEINQRSKSQRFEILNESKDLAIVDWITQSSESASLISKYENEDTAVSNKTRNETQTQSLEFKLVKENEYWKIVFEQYGIYEN